MFRHSLRPCVWIRFARRSKVYNSIGNAKWQNKKLRGNSTQRPCEAAVADLCWRAMKCPSLDGSNFALTTRHIPRQRKMMQVLPNRTCEYLANSIDNHGMWGQSFRYPIWTALIIHDNSPRTIGRSCECTKVLVLTYEIILKWFLGLKQATPG